MKKTEENKKEDWTYIRVKKSTIQKLKILKAKLSHIMYDDTLIYLLSKENLEFKK
jgi:hypothetical protein